MPRTQLVQRVFAFCVLGILSLAGAGLIACGGSSNGNNNNSPTQHLYGAELSGGIAVFAVAENGNLTPSATISGANTGLTQPVGIALDGSGNIYVANPGNILVYAAGANGNVAPIATIPNGVGVAGITVQ